MGISGVIENRQTIRVPKSCVVQTPELLADAMVRALGTKPSDTWLEPCVGHGALLNAMSKIGVQKSKITGLDVDARPRPNDRFGKVSRGSEFLRWSSVTQSRFDKIVANPPYIAIERLSRAIRAAAIAASLSDDIKITANGNAWYAFLCAAIRLLKNDGSLCFLLPAAWDFANYAAPLRNSIAKYFSEVEIYRTAIPIFRAARVQEGAIVLLARGRRDPNAESSLKANSAPLRRELLSIHELTISLSSRKQADKWELSSPPIVRSSPGQQSLGSILNIHLGVVTGDSSYFLLTERQRRELHLPLAAVVPILSRARHLISAKMTYPQWARLKEADERIWLFNPRGAVTSNTYVQSYLRFGRRGGCQIENHKIAIRNPWFRVAAIPKIDGFISGMSSSMPWLSFKCMPNLVATNTLYVANFVEARLTEAQRLGVAMSLLTSDVRDQMRGKGRAYAAGLLKYEPSDLLSLRVPAPDEIVTDWVSYRRALRALREGEENECRKIADGCLL